MVETSTIFSPVNTKSAVIGRVLCGIFFTVKTLFQLCALEQEKSHEREVQSLTIQLFTDNPIIYMRLNRD